ncbi:IS66 family insertion sequence element accessory protein TnpB [Chryseomicrobium palamuruense]|uniref:IS66 family insertion sequence element accessory protein TnpB n=1 Tax=Chryseomicrobium palamuruense TaxID=682973 RepID=A0ABV8UZY8_9BACL
MIIDFSMAKNVYIICGNTDMRKGIDGLATLIQDSFEMDPYGESVFLFSGRKKDRYKCLVFDGDGFALLYKRLDNGKLQWPRDESEVRCLSQQEVRWLLEGLSVAQPKAIGKSKKGIF